jgi:hypothetical protein
VVGQPGRVLLHSATSVGIGEAALTEEGTREASSGAVTIWTSRSTGRITPAARRVTFGSMWPGSWWMATGRYIGGSVQG